MANRYSVTAAFGESGSLFYVVDGDAPDGEQPAVVATHVNRKSAQQIADEMNRDMHFICPDCGTDCGDYFFDGSAPDCHHCITENRRVKNA